MADELLRALGRRQGQPPVGLEGDPEHGGSEQARALLRPFEGQERAALLDDVLARLDAEPGASTDTSASIDTSANAESSVSAGLGTTTSPDPSTSAEASASPEAAQPPVDLAARRQRNLAWVGLATALAASLVLWLGLRDTGPASGEALPPYAATRLDGGTSAMRSGPASPPSSITLAPDASIDWIFTPRSPVRTPVGAVLLAIAPGEPARLVRPGALEVSEEGVVRIAGPLAKVLPLSPGTWSVTVLLGAPDSLPHTADEAEAGEGRAWSRVSFEVTIASAP